jgi:hypothetical protein
MSTNAYDPSYSVFDQLWCVDLNNNKTLFILKIIFQFYFCTMTNKSATNELYLLMCHGIPISVRFV